MESDIDPRELLFFDTFSHESTEDLNLDLVQFPRPVLIHEVRVVPLGTRVTADFPGGVRLGATTPNSFKLELFVNNLRKRNACTFEKLGILNYEQNVDIQLISDAKLPTDGLILKGWYTTITVAVYGCITNLSEKDHSSPPPPPPTSSRSKPQAIVPNTPDELKSSDSAKDPWPEGHEPEQPYLAGDAEEKSSVSPMAPHEQTEERRKDEWEPCHSRSQSKEREHFRDYRDDYREREYWDYRDQKERSWTPDRRSRSPGHQSRNWTPPPHERGPSPNHDERRKPVSRDQRKGNLVAIPMQEDEAEAGEIPEDIQGDTMDIYEGIPDDIPSDGKGMYDNLSDGEIQDPDGDAYSEISSDENLLADMQERYQADWSEVDLDDAWIGLNSLNPDQCDLAPMDTFDDPGMTPYEITKQKLLLKRDAAVPEEASELLNIVDEFQNAPHNEKWIDAMDKIPSLIIPGLTYIVNKMENKDVLERIVEWTFEGLSVKAAMSQPIAYNLRHLKMGIRMAAALCSCDSFVAFAVLSKEVQHSLLDLYESPNMSSSVKLHIIKALDSSTRLHEGLDWMLGKHHLQIQVNEGQEKTAYQRVTQIIMQKQVVRCSQALSALLRKVHCYQKISQLVNAVSLTQDNYSKWMVDNAIEEQKSAESDEEREANDPQQSGMLENISPNEVHLIIDCLEEAAKVLVYANSLIAQPRRCLPNSIMYAERQKPFDPYPNLYHIFSKCRLLESIFVLLSSPATCSHVAIFTAVRSFLDELLGMHSGLLYLSAKTDTVNGILRLLTQQMGYQAEDGSSEHPTHLLGNKLLYYLQTLQIIDQLRDYHSRDDKDLYADEAIVLGLLHNLYRMTSASQGAEAVVHVMTMEDNMTVLLPFIELTGDEEKDQVMRKSINHNYAVLLILLIVRETSNVEWLQKYGTRVLSSCDTEKSSNKLADKVSELSDWLHPIEKVPAFDHDVAIVDQLVTQMKKLAEDVGNLPAGLVTVLRILCHLAIDKRSEKNDFVVEELKHKHMLIEMFSLGCVPVFINIIQKVGDLCLRPWQQGIPQCGPQATIVLGLLRSCLLLLKAIQSYLIQCRGKQFKDCSVLPCIFNLHTVMCSVSSSGTLPPRLQEIQNLIIDILMAFTQPVLEAKEFEEGLKQSLWTMMMKEVLLYSLTAPYTFLSGLVMISELLPLPLPLQSREPLTETEVESAFNSRKLWGAHLFPITSEMQELIKAMSDTSCQALQRVLMRVCWQLADLSPPTALSIVRCLLDVIIDSMDATIDKQREDKDETRMGEERASQQTSRILNLFAFLMNQPPIKISFLHLTQSSAKADEKYADILKRFATLLNVVSDKNSHTLTQMSIVSIFQSLCDAMVSMAGTALPPLEQLASSLPDKNQLLLICVGLLEHINNREHKFSSILPSLRTLTLLMDHDYGFYHVKLALDAVPTAFFQLFTLINTTFSKDSSDCMATLSSAAECIQFLVSAPDPPPMEGEVQGDTRTFSISWQEVRTILGWTEEIDNHPLDDLDKLLQEYAKEEEALKAIHESINSVCTFMKAPSDVPKSSLNEPELPAPESLMSQFSMRAVYTLTDDEDERLSSMYWLSTPMAEESDQEIEKVECDLDDMNRKYCPDYDLVAELAKGAIPSDALTTLKPRRRIRSTKDTINTSKMRGNNRGFIAPMRGRGFGRGMPTNRNDLFRSRPPNTSRPPSMHVDDFIKMESEGQAPTMPTGMNPQLRRMEKEQGGTGRGRGNFDRGGGNNNRRFPNAQPNYQRHRDQNLSSSYSDAITSTSFSTSRGGHVSQRQDLHQWAADPRQSQQRNPYGSRAAFPSDRHQTGRFNQHGGRGRGGGGSRTDWQQGNRRDSDRFGQQRQGAGFHGIRDGRGGRHQRSFTK